MAQVTMTKCDHCEKRVDNPYQHPGWIQLGASRGMGPVHLSRATGVYGASSYETDFVDGVSDFCSIDCLVAALDKKARERDTEKKTQAAQRASA